jgi:Uncharacterised protein conserved in bacteria (DUF2336)
MSTIQQVISELDGAIASGSKERRGQIADNIAALFVSHAHVVSDDEIALFDEILMRLTTEIEISARAILAARLAPIPNAPPNAIRNFAFDDAIEVASPVLSRSERLTDINLVENVRRKSQGHLLAITQRRTLSEIVTDVLVERGNRDVLLGAVRNSGSRFSNAGFSILVHRSEGDAELAIGVGGRSEIPRYLFQQLLEMASQAVRTKLTAMRPEAFEKINAAVEEAAEQIEAVAAERSQWREPSPNKPVQQNNAKEPSYESDKSAADPANLAKIVAMLSSTCEMPPSFVERAIAERKLETILVLARAANLSWPTLKAVLMSRRGGRPAEAEISRSLAAYERLKPQTALEILRFYRSRAKQ